MMNTLENGINFFATLTLIYWIQYCGMVMELRCYVVFILDDTKRIIFYIIVDTRFRLCMIHHSSAIIGF
jgi:hypothetical protein